MLEKNSPPSELSKNKKSCLFNQAVNFFISAPYSAVLTVESMGSCSLLQPQADTQGTATFCNPT